MCKTSEKPVRNMSIHRGLYTPLSSPQKSFTHHLAILPKLSTDLYAKFYTIKTTLTYLFEQVLYPTSTALIIVIIIKEKNIEGACA